MKSPTAQELADYDLETLTAIFSEPPALHRFPKAMAARVQDIARILVERYDGDAEKIWTGAADGKDAFKRIAELPGVRQAESADLPRAARQAVRPTAGGWREAAGDRLAERYRQITIIALGESILVRRTTR